MTSQLTHESAPDKCEKYPAPQVTKFTTTFRLYRCAGAAGMVRRLIYSDGTKDRFKHSMLTGEVQRARRYEVAFAIQYRQRRRRHWRSGMTQNISASGVLFGEAAGDRQLQLQLHAPLEMELTIPSNVPGGPVTRILCSGRVSRIVDPGTSDGPRSVAATIAKYRLLRT